MSMILDELPQPDSLGVEALRRCRDLFQDAAITAAREGDDVLANWARAVADRYALELTLRARYRRVVERWIDES